jgi:anti-sigma regulatory factor (Ser/Thr protein kinase)
MLLLGAMDVLPIGTMAALAVSLPRSRDAAGFARRAMAPIAVWLPADKAYELNLIVSELVNNAVEHGAGKITVRIRALPHLIAGSVCDEGVGFAAPTIATRDDNAGGGWGLSIVDQLTQRWGVELDATRVWFELVIP